MCWKINVFVVRQFLQLLAVSFSTFSAGVITAFPSVLNPAILSPDSDIKATPDQASWITACLSISGIVGYAIMPAIFQVFGRKVSNIVTNLVILIGCITYYLSKDVYALAFARLTQGISLPGFYAFVIGLSECVSPKRRGCFMVFSKITLAFGALACHSLAFVLTWRQIAILTALPSCLSIVAIVVTAESPSFFAMRGQFDKCSETFKWYRGNSINAKKELEHFVAAQTKIYIKKEKEKQNNTNYFIKAWKMVITKHFRKSFYIVTLAKLCLDFCGRYFILAYITQILTEVTNNKSLAMYLSVISDFITIVALTISYFLVKRFTRRVLLFNLGFLSVSLMFMVSISLILKNKVSFFSNVKWLTPTLILVHLFVTNVGLIPMVFTLAGEVFSLEHRGIGLFLSGIIFLSFYSLVLKFTPLLMDRTGVEGVYSIYGLCLLTFLLILQKILIETKDRTLQQIEDELRGKVRDHTEIELLKSSEVNNC